MAAEVEKMRPNIRIEIHNNLTEDLNMDVDEGPTSDNEEGEISDDNDKSENVLVLPKTAPELPNKIWTSTKEIFTTGINIFDKEEQEKLQERAKRFALKPEEINVFTDEDLQELHDSLGITTENENDVRFEAVHMRGINEMNTEDVLDYFVKYAPTGIEWIDVESCNIVWSDNISAARAMHYTSQTVRGMPARDLCNPFAKEFLDDIEEPEKETGESILLKNKNREVELKVDEDVVMKTKPDLKNSVDISEITIPIPPGYWRLGQKHPKAKCLLFRFALLTDKKPYKSEKFSKYYKKYGNKGVISESKKKEIRSIFERNKDLNHDKNPWGSLARNWDHDAKFREREPVIYEEEPKIEIKNPKILARLGIKRKREESENEEAEEESEEEEKEDEPKKKSKVPRMRMYADEEEEKLKRKKLLTTIKLQAEKIATEERKNRSDLRNVLGKKPVKEEIVEQDITDLGRKLKNRSKKMIFTVDRGLDEFEEEDEEEIDSKEQVQADIRSILSERRARSPLHIRRRISPPRRSPELRERQRSPDRRRRRSLDRGRRPSPYRRRSAERTLHSDRMYSSRSRNPRRHHSNYLEEKEEYSHKPRSKVAVVIKTQKKPTVASTIWSRVKKPSDSEESSSESNSEDSESDKSSSSSESESESESEEENQSQNDSSDSSTEKRNSARPGFNKSRLSDKFDNRSPLKITMTNDRFKK